MVALLAAMFALSGLQNPSLDQRVASVLPTVAEDAWLKIPWRVDLMQARREAAELHKPLFLWTMNGHPLGTT
jgi:hypothetical protein